MNFNYYRIESTLLSAPFEMDSSSKDDATKSFIQAKCCGCQKTCLWLISMVQWTHHHQMLPTMVLVKAQRLRFFNLLLFSALMGNAEKASSAITDETRPIIIIIPTSVVITPTVFISIWYTGLILILRLLQYISIANNLNFTF